LEKIEMKKTLVAVAALAAVAGAHAEATIGGLVDGAIYTQTTKNSSSVSATTQGIGAANNGADELFFMASEDLGDGLKANARLGFNASASTGTTSPSNRISYVGLSSATFGEVQIGQQWKPGFFTVLFGDFTGLVALSGAGLVGDGSMVAYTANSITYTSPSISGLGFQFQKGYGETAGSQAGSSTGYRVDYRNGGLYAGYSAQTSTLASGGTFKGNTIGDSTADTLYTSSTNTAQIKSSAYGATYDFGIAKVGLTYNTGSVGGTAKNGSTYYSLSAPVGPVVVAATFANGQQVTSAAASTDTTGQRYAVFYDLTKRTQVYAFTGTSTAGSVRKTTESALGVKHTF